MVSAPTDLTNSNLEKHLGYLYSTSPADYKRVLF